MSAAEPVPTTQGEREALRRIARGATTGPWRRQQISATRSDVRGYPENTSYDARGDAVATAADSEFGACPDADALFIATFDPVMVMALLDRIDELEATP